MAIDPLEPEAQGRIDRKGQHPRALVQQPDGLLGGGEQSVGDHENIVIRFDQPGQAAKVLDRLEAHPRGFRAVLAGDDVLPQPADQARNALAAEIDRAIELMRKDRAPGEDPERALSSLLVGILGKSGQDGDAQRWRVPRLV